ncbi:MAG: DsbE family thiol:disulfide interchange protein [Candidatus Competibacterales bacterium]
MVKRFLLGALVVAFVGLLAVLGLGLSNDPSRLPSVLLDRPLPAFELPRLQTPEVLVTAGDLEGEVALLNVWATWCPPCRTEHPYLLQLARRGVPIVGVNYKDQRDAALTWLVQLGNPYRFNIEDAAGQLGIDLGVYGAPETFLLDASGVIRYRHAGVLDPEVWQREFVPRIAQLTEEDS